jgi:hypothetical protein
MEGAIEALVDLRVLLARHGGPALAVGPPQVSGETIDRWRAAAFVLCEPAMGAPSALFEW